MQQGGVRTETENAFHMALLRPVYVETRETERDGERERRDVEKREAPHARAAWRVGRGVRGPG